MTDKYFEYFFSKEDINKAFNFVVSYHLNPTKGQRGRTNTGMRGFGGELDEFIPGKLVEIAFCKILEKFDKNKKKFEPDFEIYDNKEVGDRKDPDVTKVIENDKERKPKSFIEIKRLQEIDNWLGPRMHQFGEGKEGYMVHISIDFDNDYGVKHKDITASILKSYLSEEFNLETKLNLFSELESLKAKLHFIYPFKLIREKGHLFKAGEIIPDTEFPSGATAINQNGTFRKNFNIIDDYMNVNQIKLDMKIEPNATINNENVPKYSQWELSGSFALFESRGKEYIHCYQDSVMFNQVFGHYELEKDTTYKFFFRNKLEGKTTKNIDDYWFSKKRLNELFASNSELTIEKQLENILSTI